MPASAGRALLWLAAAALLYVLSGALLVPRLVAARWVEPGPTALMRLRAEEGVRAVERPWLRLKDVPVGLLDAVLAGEDDLFPLHGGFDVEQLRAALQGSVRERRLGRGASTISQQLVKNLFLSPARNPLRKAKEAVLTVALEAALPKPRILELYVNVIEWGRGVYGVGAAARTYFGRPAGRLTREQSALLAATIPDPLRRSPADPSRRLLARQRLLLRLTAGPSRIPPAWLRRD